jgi:hypothetical protein
MASNKNDAFTTIPTPGSIKLVLPESQSVEKRKPQIIQKIHAAPRTQGNHLSM